MAFRYLEIKQQLLNRLFTLEPNVRLPSRNELCQEYLVTRTTIDRAVSELVREGYLYSVDGSGTYVADYTAGVTIVRRNMLNVGVLLPNISHDTYPGILAAIERVMQREGVNIVVCNTDHDFGKQRSCIRRMINSGVRGIIMVPAIAGDQVTDLKFFEELSQIHIPLVFCNRKIDGIRAPLVCSNNFYGGYLATRHLLECGYRKIAYLSPVRYRINTERYQGYLSALWEAGCAVDHALNISAPQQTSVALGYELARKLLAEHPDVDGIFGFNDQIALGAMNAIRESGRRVSQDIGVIGYDDSVLCDVPAEKLTSVAFMVEEIGVCAAETLLVRIRTPERPIDPMTVFRPELRVRKSCTGRGE